MQSALRFLTFGYRRHQEGIMRRGQAKKNLRRHPTMKWNHLGQDVTGIIWITSLPNCLVQACESPQSSVWKTWRVNDRAAERIESQTMIEPPRGSTKDNSVSAMKLESKICVSFAKLSLATQSETDNIVKNTKSQCSGDEQLKSFPG